MKTSIEKIRELSLEEFEKLINYIELDKLTKLLMENALNLPTTSNYYISPKGRKGVFWVGGSFTGKNNKVRAFYTSVIYLNKDVHIEPNFFLEFLDEYSELDEKYKKNSGIYKIYSKLFDIECNIEDNNSPNDVEISTDCLKKIETLKNEYEVKIKDLNELLDSKDKEIKRLKKELNDKDTASDIRYINKRASIVSKVSTNNYTNGFCKIIESNKLKTETDIKRYLDECLVKNAELVKNNDFKSLSELLTYEYLLSSLLED